MKNKEYLSVHLEQLLLNFEAYQHIFTESPLVLDTRKRKILNKALIELIQEIEKINPGFLGEYEIIVKKV